MQTITGSNGVSASKNSTGVTVSGVNATQSASGMMSAADKKSFDRELRSLIPKGSSIPANANLNTIDYLKVGSYYCSGNNTAKTLKNSPTTSAFCMEVFSLLSKEYDNETTSTWCYRYRLLTTYEGAQYWQYCQTQSKAGEWLYYDWNKVPTMTDVNSKANSSDLTKYLLIDGTRVMTGNLVINKAGVAQGEDSGHIILKKNNTDYGNIRLTATNSNLAIESKGGIILYGGAEDSGTEFKNVNYVSVYQGELSGHGTVDITGFNNQTLNGALSVYDNFKAYTRYGNAFELRFSGGNTGLEIGRRDGTAGSAYIDFHTDGKSATDFNNRIIANGNNLEIQSELVTISKSKLKIGSATLSYNETVKALEISVQ